MLKEYFYIQLSTWGLLIPLEHTAGVLTLNKAQICPIPGIPPAILGVVNQRGKLLWVLELSDLLGLDQEAKIIPSYNLTLVVLTASENTTDERSRQVGCVVSVPKEIVVLDSLQFQPVPASLNHSFLSGVVEIEKSLVYVLNVNAVFTALANLDILVTA